MADADRAVTVWSTLDLVTNGPGGGNELVGGIWILLVSIVWFVGVGVTLSSDRDRVEVAS